MNEEKKKEIAMFRFSVISDLVVGVCLSGEELEHLITEKSDRMWHIPYSNRRSVSKSTIRRWIKKYLASNKDITSLYPKQRKDRGESRVIDLETGATLIQFKNEFPNVCVRDLLLEMKKKDLIQDERDYPISTVYRFLKQHGALKKNVAKVDRRRFEAEFPNDIWQSDVMHGPQVILNGKRKKSYLIAFLDDHSRLIPHASFYPSESVKDFLQALKRALMSRGLPRKLYTDNGSAYRSKHLEFVMASLQVSLIRAKPYSPESKGKVERFFRTVRGSFLRQEAPDDLTELNERFACWLQDNYHTKIHSSTSETPLDRFVRHIEMIRSAPDNLWNYFRTSVMRTVTKDRVVHLEGKLYETPIDLISERIELLYHPDKMDRVEARFKGKNYGELRLLDPGVNARVLRHKSEGLVHIKTEEEPSTPPKTGRLFDGPNFDPTNDHKFF